MYGEDTPNHDLHDRRLRTLPNHHEYIRDGAVVQQELTRHSSYLRRGVEGEVVHTCHPHNKPEGQRSVAGGLLYKRAGLYCSPEVWRATLVRGVSECALSILTCRFRPNVSHSERVQERRETPAWSLVESC